MRRLQGWTADGRVGHNEGRDAACDRDLHDVVDIRRLQIGCDLQEYRLPQRPCIHRLREQIVERGLVLQRAQAGGVGRTDIDRQIIGKALHIAHAGHIIRDPVHAVLIRADINPDRSHAPIADQMRKPCHCIALPFIVEAHPVNHRAIFDQTEQARLRITRLRKRCQRSDFRKTKTESQYFKRNFGIFVISCRKSDGISKVQRRHILCQNGIGRTKGCDRRNLQHGQRQIMGPFCIRKKQKRPDKCVEHAIAYPTQ